MPMSSDLLPVSQELHRQSVSETSKDAQPDDEMRQELKRDQNRLETKLANTETVINRLLDAVERGVYSASL